MATMSVMRLQSTKSDRSVGGGADCLRFRDKRNSPMKQELDAVVVNAGCLMFFPEPQRVALKNDVLDSMLYVQLAASKQHSKFAEPEKWNETRLTAAQRFGWLPSA
ncbi:hypothetical protein ALP63_04449, partial [Pseudomonas syringae pv. aceris]